MDRVALSSANLAAKDEHAFAARMTNIQFSALAARLDRAELMTGVKTALEKNPRRRGKLADPAEVRKWLVNSWSTETLLRGNIDALNGDALRHALHWAFPQAYYSAFALLQAYYRATGVTVDSHAGSIRQFGVDLSQGKYPSSLAFYAEGYPPSPAGLTLIKSENSLYFDRNDESCVETRVWQFLNATRRQSLAERKETAKLRTKSGRPRKNFSKAEWTRLSDALGVTSVLSCLYRKRIKANYRDIDSFLHHELDAGLLLRDLVSVVKALNFVHECFIATAMGLPFLETAISGLPPSVGKVPGARLDAIKSCLP